MDPTSFKVALVGDGGVGKTTFLQRHSTGEFNKSYLPTSGSSQCSLKFMTNYGQIEFQVTEYAGQEKFAEQDYNGNDAVITMFDVHSKVSHHNVNNWLTRVYEQIGVVPTVICGNKCDIKGRKVTSNHIMSKLNHLDKKHQTKMMFYDISSKSNYHFEHPFVALAKKLTGHEDLVLTEQEPLWPVEVKWNPSPKL